MLTRHSFGAKPLKIKYKCEKFNHVHLRIATVSSCDCYTRQVKLEMINKQRVKCTDRNSPDCVFHSVNKAGRDADEVMIFSLQHTKQATDTVITYRAKSALNNWTEMC